MHSLRDVLIPVTHAEAKLIDAFLKKGKHHKKSVEMSDIK